ncbi:hypothetical protein BH24ACT12_BH24ACT12_17230 [soil metagenome]
MTSEQAGGAPRVVGVVVAPDRGGPGWWRLHGVRFLDHAVKALSEVPGCDVVVVDEAHGTRELSVSRMASGYDVVLVHDPLCPLVPASTLSACAAAFGASGVLIGVLPVTDTVKSVVGDVIASTLDRDALRLLAAPVAFATSWVPALERRLPHARDLHDLARLFDVLGALTTPVPVEVPSLARRVADAEDITVLECLDEVGHSPHADVSTGGTTGPGAPRPPAGPRRT